MVIAVNSRSSYRACSFRRMKGNRDQMLCNDSDRGMTHPGTLVTAPKKWQMFGCGADEQIESLSTGGGGPTQPSLLMPIKSAAGTRADAHGAVDTRWRAPPAAQQSRLHLRQTPPAGHRVICHRRKGTTQLCQRARASSSAAEAMLRRTFMRLQATGDPCHFPLNTSPNAPTPSFASLISRSSASSSHS